MRDFTLDLGNLWFTRIAGSLVVTDPPSSAGLARSMAAIAIAGYRTARHGIARNPLLHSI
jgi:hypothetical protein